MAKSLVIGIDPGMTGALALYDADGFPLQIEDMPVVNGEVNGWELNAILRRWTHAQAVIVEQVSAMPRQGVSSTFKFGKGYGMILGAATGLGFKLGMVTPVRWTKHYNVGSDKGLHRQRAMELFPQQAEMFKRVKDDGRADAALIAKWGAEEAVL